MISIRSEGERGCGRRKPGGIYLVAGKHAGPCGKLPLPLGICPCCGHGIKPSRGWTWTDPQALFMGRECRKGPGGLESPPDGPDSQCQACPLNDANLSNMASAGILWIGERYYATPEEFLREGYKMGISRRISVVPRGFKLGETWVFFAHRKAIRKECHTCGGTTVIPSGGCICQPCDLCRNNTCMEDGCCDECGRAVDACPDTVCRICGKPGNPGTLLDECPTCCGEGDLFTPAIFGCFKPTAIEYIMKGDESPEDLERLQKRGFTLVELLDPEDPGKEALRKVIESGDPWYRCPDCGAISRIDRCLHCGDNPPECDGNHIPDRYQGTQQKQVECDECAGTGTVDAIPGTAEDLEGPQGISKQVPCPACMGQGYTWQDPDFCPDCENGRQVLTEEGMIPCPGCCRDFDDEMGDTPGQARLEAHNDTH